MKHFTYKRVVTTVHARFFFIASILLCAGPIASSGTAQSCVPAPSGLVGLWSAEGTTVDSVSGIQATVVGTVPYVAGEVGQAFSFSGAANTGINLGYLASLRLQDFTIEAWVQPSSVTSANDRSILAYGSTGYALGIHTNGAPYLSEVGTDILVATKILPDTGFHHVAVTKSGTTVVFYVDGVPYPAASPYTSTFGFGAQVVIGADPSFYAPPSGTPFTGKIDEVSVYGRALTDHEIQTIYAAGSAGKCIAFPPTIGVQPASQTVVTGSTIKLSVTAGGNAPLSYQWQFNGSNISGATTSLLTFTNIPMAAAGTYSVMITNVYGTTNSAPATLTVLPPGCQSPPAGLVSWWRAENNFYDEISGNNGIVEGTVTYTTGKNGQAFNFNASSVISLPNVTGLQLQDLTIEGWIQPSSVTTPFYYRYIFSWTYGGYGFGLDNNGALFFGRAVSSLKVSDTGFHHLAATKSGTTVIFYLDGVSQTVTNYPDIFSFGHSAVIGGLIDNASYDLQYAFSGKVDELSIYSRPLSANEIQAIYAVGAAGKCVTAPPYLAQQPASQVVPVSGSNTFQVVAAGVGPLSYQWYFNNAVIPGATNATFSITNAQPANAGNYFVTVSDSNGPTNSATAVFSVNPPGCTPVPSGLVSWWQAESNLVDAIGSANGQPVGTQAFGAGETGNAFSFNGAYTNGINLGNPSGLQLEIFTIEGWIQLASPTATGDRYILGYSSGGYAFGVQSNGNLFLGKTGDAKIASGYVFTDTAFHHVAVVRSATALTFYVDGVPYPSLVVPDAFYFNTLAAIGARLDIQGPPSGGIVTSSVFSGKIDELSVYNRALSSTEIQNIFVAGSPGKCAAIPPQVVVQPVGKTVVVGSNANLSVTAGPAQLTYQWQFNDVNIDGATTSTLNITNAQPANIGNYSVSVGNLNGSTNSATAALNVVPSGCAPVPSGVVSWWPGEGTFLDLVGGNNGLNPGSVTFAPGEVGQALSLNGRTGVDLGSPTSLQLSDFTIEAWIQLPNPSSGGDQPILGYQKDGYFFGVRGTGALFLSKPDGDGLQGAFIDVVTSRYVLSDTAFHHVGVTKNGTKVIFYVDGVAYTGPDFTGTFNFDSPAAIGGDWGNQRFSGKIDELCLYNRALAALEIQAIAIAGTNGKCGTFAPVIAASPESVAGVMGGSAIFNVSVYGTAPFGYQWNFNGIPINGATASTFALTNVQLSDAGFYSVTVTNAYGAVTSSNTTMSLLRGGSVAPPFGLVGWWRAEGNAIDLANTNNGTLHGGVTYATGEVGQAFNLDGTTGTGISVTNTSALQLQDFTIEAWIQLASVPPAGDQTIFGYGSTGYDFLVRTTGALGLSRVGTDIVVSSFVIADTLFHHVAVTKNGGTEVFYLDGAAYTAPAYFTSYSFTTSPAIGATGTTGVFKGKLDEVSVYNRALNAPEIQSIYAAGVTGKSVVALTNPTLIISQTNGSVLLSWPVSPTGFNLESATGVGVSNWTSVALTPVTNLTGGNITVTLPPSGMRQYYRLHHP